MSKFFGSVVFFLAISLLQLQAQEIEFQTGSWSEVKALAKKEQKPIFLDIYAVWCGPCKYMTNTVFKDATVANFMNKHYVNYKLDGEKGEGIELAQKYNLAAYPTMFFFDMHGEITHKFVGGADAATFLQLSDAALKPENQLYTLKAKFDKGERAKDFMSKYLDVLKNTYELELMASTLEIYWKDLSDTEKLSEENMNLVTLGISDYKSDIFKFFLQNRKSYEDKLGKDYVAEYVNSVMDNSIASSIKDANLKEKDLAKLCKEYYPLFEDKKYVDAKIAYLYYSNRHSDTKKAYKAYDNYFNNYSSWNEIIAFVWHLINEHETVNYKKALVWMNTAVAKSKNPYTLEVRATLLNKMEKKKEALLDAKEAKKLYDSVGENSDDLEELLKELEQ